MSVARLESLEKSLENLMTGYQESTSGLDRDGCILRFKATFELCWKISKKLLLEMGFEVDTSRSIFGKMAMLEWIEDYGKWESYLKAKVKTSQFYSQDAAEEVFLIIPEFIHSVENLILVLEKNINLGAK